MTGRDTCLHVRGNGERCKSFIGLSEKNGLCPMHDPDRAEQMERARAAGREAYKPRARQAKVAAAIGIPEKPETLEDAAEWASWALRALALGQIDTRIASGIASLVNAFKGAKEKAELEKELRSMREQLSQARKLGLVK